MKKIITILALISLIIGFTGCSNNTGSDDEPEVLYKIESGVITNATYNIAITTIQNWTYVDYSKVSALRLYLYNNTISDHQVQNGVKLSEIQQFLSKYFSKYELEQEIAFLKRNGNDIAFFETKYGTDKKAWIYATK